MNYTFKPEDYGFEPIENFPELAKFNWYGVNTYIKVTENGGKELGRKVFWYKACKLHMQDDRITFYSHSYDASNTIVENYKFPFEPRQTYFGIINSHEFATLLLKNLFGTLHNNSADTIGKERLERNINEIAKLPYNE